VAPVFDGKLRTAANMKVRKGILAFVLKIQKHSDTSQLQFHSLPGDTAAVTNQRIVRAFL
jgi:hypothetical protein